MDELEKKAIILLKSLIFHYHGMDDDERALLEDAVQKLNAANEMNWANQFISEDHTSAFERSRDFLQKTFLQMPVKERVAHLVDVWNDTYSKGYLTETEATAMLTLSTDWSVEGDFLKEVKN